MSTVEGELRPSAIDPDGGDRGAEGSLSPGAATEAVDRAFVDGYDRLVRLASLIVGADAEDAVMDAVIRVRSRPRQIDEPAAYLRAAVLNECRSRYRRQTRAPHLVPAPVGPGEPDLDDVWDVVLGLPPDQRAVVALRSYEDLTVPQIAELLDMPDGTVKSHLHRAVATLRATIGERP
jgi:DNA-directed RNA polymerase specialized sigma24 family protein